MNLPKKGDLQHCGNWRGITLLSVPSKILCRVLLNRIEGAIDVKLRQEQEQAGFRGGKGCTDQIFALRNIIEQSIVWNAPLCICFIDFKKAFDNIHHSTLWNILRHYGLRQKIVDLISILYQNFKCSLLMERNQTNSFSVRSRVRQGCILSPILFNIARYYIMRQTTQNAQHGIQWTFFSQLEDLDYADDIALSSTTANHMQKKEQLFTENAMKTRLQINQKKTKVMCMNLKERPQIKIDEEEFEVVTDFTYLGSNTSVQNSVLKYISARINKARNSYCSLRNIWKSNVYSIKSLQQQSHISTTIWMPKLESQQE